MRKTPNPNAALFDLETAQRIRDSHNKDRIPRVVVRNRGRFSVVSPEYAKEHKLEIVK